MSFLRNHPIFTVIVIALAVWLAWNPAMNAFFGGRHGLKNGIEGEWVGQLDISKGYNPASMGATPGPHRHAAIYFKIEMTSLAMADYGGPGELFIAGEAQPRTIRVGGIQNGRFSGAIYSQPTLAPAIHGYCDPKKPTTMTMYSESNLEFTGSLHQGTRAEYDGLVSQLKANP
jgi:hypothetical protein